jgi:hypothetical protein
MESVRWQNFKMVAAMGVAALLFSLAAAAQSVVPTPVTRVTRVMTYSQFDGGAVLFQTRDIITGCENGFFIRKSDPGFDALLSLLLSTHRDGAPVQVYAETGVLWPFSAGNYCHAMLLVAL